MENGQPCLMTIGEGLMSTYATPLTIVEMAADCYYDPQSGPSCIRRWWAIQDRVEELRD